MKTFKSFKRYLKETTDDSPSEMEEIASRAFDSKEKYQDFLEDIFEGEEVHVGMMNDQTKRYADKGYFTVTSTIYEPGPTKKHYLLHVLFSIFEYDKSKFELVLKFNVPQDSKDPKGKTIVELSARLPIEEVIKNIENPKELLYKIPKARQYFEGFQKKYQEMNKDRMTWAKQRRDPEFKKFHLNPN